MWFADKIKISFKAVRKDITGLKRSVHDWVLHLNSTQTELTKRVEQLEKRVRMLETEKRLLTAVDVSEIKTF